MGAEERGMSEEELEAWATVTERGAAPSCPEWWKLWVQDRIKVQNMTGTDIVVMVHRFKDLRQLKSVAAEAKVNITGEFGLGGTAEFAHTKGHAQVVPVAAGEMITIDLGGGAQGAYVTAWTNGDHNQVYVKDMYVKPRRLLTVTPGHIHPAVGLP